MKYFIFILRPSAVWQQPHMQSIHAFTPHQVAKNATKTAQQKSSESRYLPPTHQQFTKPKPDTSIRDCRSVATSFQSAACRENGEE